jgi:predicted 2-oxoglutarate/Fe(II)-dependent dioxygenase YbiX
MTYPLVIKNFITKEENDYFLNWIEENNFLYDQHTSSVEYWSKRCIYYNSIRDEVIKTKLVNLIVSIKNVVEENSISDQKLFVEYPQFVKWENGVELPPHADNIEPDGITPNATPWRSHGCVLYFNSSFDGGELYYPNLNIEVKPEAGMLVAHPAGLKFLHGVKKVESGTRQTMSTFFTYDENFRNVHRD